MARARWACSGWARGEVFSAEQERGNRRIGRSDLRGPEDGAWRLEEQQQRRHGTRRRAPGEGPCHLFDVASGLDLWQQHAVEPLRSAEELDVRFPVRRLHLVESNQP